MSFETIQWVNNQVRMIDQRLLPTQEIYNLYSTHVEVADAIKTMVVRGAPAIGVAGAFGLALAAFHSKAFDADLFKKEITDAAKMLNATRPTAVNLSWGLNRIVGLLDKNAARPVAELKNILITEAQAIATEDVLINKLMGSNGAELLNDGDTVLTHCNAGALATAGFGTALGVIYAAKNQGKTISVYADETRPFLQGARLTAWELQKNGINTTLITDNMAGWMMKLGKINKIIVGADRIAANGDVANKIGTYTVAVLANRHNIPFYVAAPLSTIDLKTLHGDQIVIEERDTAEVTHIGGKRMTPEGIHIANPAFDVTPSELVTAIVTEKGIINQPNPDKIKAIFRE